MKTSLLLIPILAFAGGAATPSPAIPETRDPAPATVDRVDGASVRLHAGTDQTAPAQARALPRLRPCAPRTDLPSKSYWNQPETPFGGSDYVAHFEHMDAFYDVPGELGFIAEGERYGFEALSFIITETQPGGGPPLHVHDTEEAHVLLEGEVEYLIGERRFPAQGPYVARVPAGEAHTFVNRGDCSFNLVAVFPSKKLSYRELGANPLVAGGAEPAAAGELAVPGAAPTRTVLFICEHGSAKSVVAAAHFNRLALERGLPARAISRGTVPDPEMSPAAVAGLRADGLQPADAAPAKLTQADLDAAARVVSFCELPAALNSRVPVERWEVPPVSVDYAAARRALVERIEELMRELPADR